LLRRVGLAENTEDNQLLEITRLAGVEPWYEDSYGRIHNTSIETAQTVLRAKGAVPEKERSLERNDVLVVSRDALPESFTLLFPKSGQTGPLDQENPALELALEDETGKTKHIDFPQGAFDARETGDGVLVRGAFPNGLEMGRYNVKGLLNWSGGVHETRAWWFICPEQAYINPQIRGGKRIAGVNIALYGVRSSRNWGIGDFTDLKGIIDWAGDDLQVDFVGVNPLHAIFNSAPYNTSPYNPSSRYYRNYIYLDPERIPDFHESSEAVEYVDKMKSDGALEELREAERVNYDAVSKLKLQVLRTLFNSFLKTHLDQGTPRAEGFRNYERSQGPYLERFAVFSALRNHFVSRPEPIYYWRNWPDGLDDSGSEQVKNFAEENAEEVLFWKYLQWQIELQLSQVQQFALDKGMMIGLYHDLALGVDGYGADAWAEPSLYLQEFTIGAPPDPFAPEGQNWGFPAPNGDAARARAYEPLIRMFNTAMEHGGAVRIDHVMQLKRLFWIPRDKRPTDGVYVTERAADLMNIISLISATEKSIIVGEDLGTVPADFREQMMNKGILSYRLFYFEEDQNGRMLSPQEYPEKALVSINTHDLPTLTGFWSGRDIDLRRDLGDLSPQDESVLREDRTRRKAKIIEKMVQEGFLPAHTAHRAWETPTPTRDLHEAVLRFLMRSPCHMVMINQEDILMDPRQQNLPGTVDQSPNWTTKMRFTLEQLRSDPQAIELSEIFRNLLITSRRARTGHGAG
jgi:4-alpha-glucanotransferase